MKVFVATAVWLLMNTALMADTKLITCTSYELHKKCPEGETIYEQYKFLVDTADFDKEAPVYELEWSYSCFDKNFSDPKSKQSNYKARIFANYAVSPSTIRFNTLTDFTLKKPKVVTLERASLTAKMLYASGSSIKTRNYQCEMEDIDLKRQL